MHGRVAYAEHHRRGRTEADPVRRTHDGEPLVGRAFRGDSLAHFVVENLAAAARHAVEARVLQPAHYRLVVEPRDEVYVMNLGRREAVELEIWIARVKLAQEVFVPLDAEVGMQPALHQHARAAERDGLVDSLANLFERLDVSVGLSRPPVEGAEGADDVADVRVVYVAVDDVRDDARGVLARANLVGGRAHARDVEGLKQGRALLRRHAPAFNYAVENRLNVCHGRLNRKIQIRDFKSAFCQPRRAHCPGSTREAKDGKRHFNSRAEELQRALLARDAVLVREFEEEFQPRAHLLVEREADVAREIVYKLSA